MGIKADWRPNPPNEWEIAAHAKAFPYDGDGGVWLVRTKKNGGEAVTVLKPGDFERIKWQRSQGWAPMKDMDSVDAVSWPVGVGHPATFPNNHDDRACDSEGGYIA